MAIREIVLFGDPVLRKPAEEVEVFDEALERLIEDMFETMYHAEGIGLAAPQIGVSRRILVVDVREREEEAPARVALVNPRVVRSSDDDLDRLAEGCLSMPGLEEVVERPWTVEVEARNLAGEPVRLEASGLLARALQHEIDHLDGILFIDRVSPLKRKMLLAKWKKLRDEAEREAVGPR
jgi:peptide deformylase